MQLFLAALALCAGPTTGPDTVVVCPLPFLRVLDPWIAHRERQGHRLALVSNLLSPAEIRDAIRAAAKPGRLRYVLLIGDAEPAADQDPEIRARCTPTYLAKAKVNIRWGSAPEIATDSWYADLDDDQVPDVAIGRIPADTPEELALMVAKILRYEAPSGHGEWQRQIHVVAGVGGFGTLTDSVLELATKKFLTEGIPAAYRTSMTYGSWQSPYCPDPRLFHAVTVERLNEGGLLWVYIGHGQIGNLAAIHVPGGAFPILNANEAKRLQCPQGFPVAVLLACYAGAFDQPDDCLAEELLKSPGGPAAVLCGSRVTMPYAMAVMSEALLEECFRQRRPTLGEVLLQAKRRMATVDSTSDNRQLLDALAAAFSPSADQLQEERLEHILLFNLLGDPLLRLAYPQDIEVQTAGEITAGESLSIVGRCPLAGSGVIELVCRRDRMTATPPTRQRFYPTDAFLRSFDAVYEQANDGVWISQPFSTAGGGFQAELPVPADSRGPCHIRVFLKGSEDVAIGAANVFVRRPREEREVAARRN